MPRAGGATPIWAQRRIRDRRLAAPVFRISGGVTGRPCVESRGRFSSLPPDAAAALRGRVCGQSLRIWAPVSPRPALSIWALIQIFRYYSQAFTDSQGDAVPLPIRWRYKLERWRNQFATMF